MSHPGATDEAVGVSGILDAYSAALTNVQLAGPTLFTEVLQTAMARANRPASQMEQRYDVLLILTDGVINDMREVTPAEDCIFSFFSVRRFRVFCSEAKSRLDGHTYLHMYVYIYIELYLFFLFFLLLVIVMSAVSKVSEARVECACDDMAVQAYTNSSTW